MEELKQKVKEEENGERRTENERERERERERDREREEEKKYANISRNPATTKMISSVEVEVVYMNILKK